MQNGALPGKSGKVRLQQPEPRRGARFLHILHKTFFDTLYCILEYAMYNAFFRPGGHKIANLRSPGKSGKVRLQQPETRRGARFNGIPPEVMQAQSPCRGGKGAPCSACMIFL